MSGNAGPGDGLLGFVKDFAERRTLQIEEDLGYGYVRLKITEAERRQAFQDIRCVEDVVMELARNSRDAGAAHLLVATRREQGRWRHLTLLDDGRGIPDPVQKRIFESRVTSKSVDVKPDPFGVHGRGMALFSIRRVAKAVDLFRSEEGRGSIFTATMDLHKTPEKKDQHTLPALDEADSGEIMKGPRNMLRTLLEVCMSSSGMQAYLGSPSEILATLCRLSRERCKEGVGPEKGEGPLWAGLHAVRDGSRLARIAEEELAIRISQRNALRVLDGEVAPLEPLGKLLAAGIPRRSTAAAGKGRKAGPGVSARFSRDEISRLEGAVSDICSDMGSRYFLEVTGCRARRSGSKIIVTVSFDERP